ncbi:uncharacterized protein M6B38_203210 [Iris pallida]|uniref:Retrotransposon gag domain-containing protein n=1 Tax=Iris pallida TaxID=29817 RepID=A0AAX6E8K6_IRIPA|nr:uncharacterized protein M6B38_203210 [Iris pallida]
MARILDNLKVEVTSMRLFDITRAWYREEPQLAKPEVSWKDFKLLFQEKFFPDVERDELQMQFEALQHGSMIVAQYTSEFTRLSRFAENLVSTPKERAWKFKKGLTRELRHTVAISQATTYASILKVSHGVEKEMDQKLKRDRDIGASSSQGPSKRTDTQQRPPQHQHHPHV